MRRGRIFLQMDGARENVHMLFTRAIIIVGELEADFLVNGCLAATQA